MTAAPAMLNRALLASCWTSAGDAVPRRGDGRSPVDIRTRIESIAATGWSGMGLGHADLVHVRDTIGLAELAAMLTDNGVATLELEFIRDWWTAGTQRAASDRVRRDLFEAAGELGVKTIKVGASNAGPFELDHLLTEFDRLASEAGSAGTRVALEPTASSDVLPTINHGVDIVRAVGSRYGGLAIDSWQTTRSGATHAQLIEILPVESVFVVELADGAEDPVGTIWEQEINQRRLPGEGAFDVVGFVPAMHDVGYEGHWGVEIISESYRRIPVREALARAHASALCTLEAAEAVLATRRSRTR